MAIAMMKLTIHPVIMTVETAVGHILTNCTVKNVHVIHVMPLYNLLEMDFAMMRPIRLNVVMMEVTVVDYLLIWSTVQNVHVSYI